MYVFVSTEEQKLDILINNAGLAATSTSHQTQDGFEIQFGVNHLGESLSALTVERYFFIRNIHI